MKIALTYIFSLSFCLAAARPPRRVSGCRRAMPRININVRSDNIIDLTYAFDENSANWPSNPFGYELSEAFKGLMGDTGVYASMNTYRQPEHMGTHMDAPSHFSKTGVAVDEVSVHSLIGPGIVLNLKNARGERFGRDSLVTIDHFRKWERDNKRVIRSGTIVFLYTGNGDVYDDHSEYFGTNITGPDAVPFIRFPGLDPDAAEWLINQRCIAAIGIDTPSIDRGSSTYFRSHQVLVASGIPIFENVGHLDVLATSNKRFKVLALPQKIRGGTGAPVRIIAITN